MDEPMLKSRHHPTFVPGCPSGSVSTASMSDDGSAVLAINGNRRCRSSFLRSLYSGPVAFHMALCSMLICLALCFMFAWLWHHEIPNHRERIALLEKKLELADVFLVEQKRAMHFLRKEVLYASSKLQSISAYEAFKREEDAEFGVQGGSFPAGGSGYYPLPNLVDTSMNRQPYDSASIYDSPGSDNKDWKRNNKGYYYQQHEQQQQPRQGMDHQNKWPTSTQAPAVTIMNYVEANSSTGMKMNQNERHIDEELQERLDVPLKDTIAHKDKRGDLDNGNGADNKATTPFL